MTRLALRDREARVMTYRTCRRCGVQKPLTELMSQATCRDCSRFCPICIACDCDAHQVPPVCVCDKPTAGWMNECGCCRRPYGPRFASLRAAWREHLATLIPGRGGTSTQPVEATTPTGPREAS